jgi:6-phosphogluconate dehydrogenase
MAIEDADIGLVGLGVMGRNLALNIADHGFSVVGLDRHEEKVEALVHDGDEDKVGGVNSLDKLLLSLRKPRAILLLVPAGKPVNEVVGDLSKVLDEGDVIIDGGNSHFTDTNRHAAELSKQKIKYLGVGISGGSDGARYGPSMMPGGPEDAYKRVQQIFEAIAAKVDDEPCVTYLGPGSAGHYVKMVHNGIEYALMQIISEAYDIMKRAGGLSNDEMADTFGRWNEGPLGSFLIEITSKVLRVDDEQTNQRLVDMILDAAKQKGTGKWTSQDAMELQAPVPTIDSAVSMRDLSGYKEEREEAAKVFPPSRHESSVDRENLIEDMANALRFAMTASYAQGMALLRAASKEYDYNLNLADIARIWRGGCIIRANMLEDIREAFRNDPDLANMILKEPFSSVMKENRRSVGEILRTAFDHEIPAPAMSTALSYFDGYRTFRLPANLIQAQRDFFGSHTYERIDSEGTFHTEWS